MQKFLISLILTLTALAVSAEEGARISLITCDAGPDIYQLEGHEGLRIVMPDGNDVVVNWGLFDFNSPNFVYRFVKGETDYRCGVIPTERFFDMYRREGRRITEHVLDLTPVQTERVIALVNENLRPENAVYRYNYVKDNCATRPIGIIECAVGDTIRFAAPGLPEDIKSFRDVMAYFHRNYPWYQFGIDLALGSGIDYRLKRREYYFAPVLFNSMLPDAVWSDGRRAVASAVIINDTPEGSAIAGPTPWWMSPMTVCMALMLAVIAVSLYDMRRRKLTRWLDSVIYGVFFIVSLVSTFLIFVSVHEATSPNWLYLWINPLTLIPAIGIWIKRAETLLFCYQIVNFVALILLLIAGIAGIQNLNPAFYPLIVSDITRSITYIAIYKCRQKIKS